MFLQINPSSALPIYAQIINQIKYLIATGTLMPKNQLPSVRQLAIQLRINPNTVAKAYRELEHEKIIFTRRGQGTFVAQEAVVIGKKERVKIITKLIDQMLVESFHLNLTQTEIHRIIKKELKKFKHRRKLKE